MLFVIGISMGPFLGTASAESQASRTFVSGRGSDSNPCTFAAPCRTLQKALTQTLAAGEIYALDPADYEPVVITKSVSIVGERRAGTVLAQGDVSAITINAGATDVVTLRGLDIAGAGSGVNGIVFTAGAALTIDDCSISGFTGTAVSIQTNGASTLSASDTLLVDNSGTAIAVQNTGFGASTTTLSNIQIVHGTVGLSVFAATSSYPTNVIVKDSTVANNGGAGITSRGFVTATVIGSTVANNGIGMAAEYAGATIKVAQSTVSGNDIAWQLADGGQIISSGDNSVGGNRSGDGAPQVLSKVEGNRESGASRVAGVSQVPGVASVRLDPDSGQKPEGGAETSAAAKPLQSANHNPGAHSNDLRDDGSKRIVDDRRPADAGQSINSGNISMRGNKNGDGAPLVSSKIRDNLHPGASLDSGLTQLRGASALRFNLDSAQKLQGVAETRAAANPARPTTHDPGSNSKSYLGDVRKHVVDSAGLADISQIIKSGKNSLRANGNGGSALPTPSIVANNAPGVAQAPSTVGNNAPGVTQTPSIVGNNAHGVIRLPSVVGSGTPGTIRIPGVSTIRFNPDTGQLQDVSNFLLDEAGNSLVDSTGQTISAR